MTKVWLVGNDESPKNNQWLAMTPCEQTAREFMAEKGYTTIKSVVPRPRKNYKGRK